jgi:hypothetical protein
VEIAKIRAVTSRNIALFMARNAVFLVLRKRQNTAAVVRRRSESVPVDEPFGVRF